MTYWYYCRSNWSDLSQSIYKSYWYIYMTNGWICLSYTFYFYLEYLYSSYYYQYVRSLFIKDPFPNKSLTNARIPMRAKTRIHFIPTRFYLWSGLQASRNDDLFRQAMLPDNNIQFCIFYQRHDRPNPLRMHRSPVLSSSLPLLNIPLRNRPNIGWHTFCQIFLWRELR